MTWLDGIIMIFSFFAFKLAYRIFFLVAIGKTIQMQVEQIKKSFRKDDRGNE